MRLLALAALFVMAAVSTAQQNCPQCQAQQIQRANPAPMYAPAALPGYCPSGTCPNVTAKVIGDGPGYKVVATPEEVLAEVNAQRAQRGLPPYQLDPKLAEGAFQCALFRARNGIEGHCGGSGGDFAFLPAGVRADAAGCARWQVGTGFGACALYETQYHYCGAAFVTVGNQRYMHVFVRR